MNSKLFFNVFVSINLFFYTSFVFAQQSDIVPHGGGTTVTTAPNGITVVNIANPHSNGTSMNNFQSFSVDPSGAILNNSTSIANTELAGYIGYNPNLNNQATVIVGEVVSMKPSQLLGFLEVAGGRAEFVLLNPNGIMCKGCGFINISSLSLITGSGVYQNNELVGANIGSGSFTNQGAGLNANLVDIFKIVSSNIKLDAPIWVKGRLEISQGSGFYDRVKNKFTGGEIANPNQMIGIDASALGSMYAGQVILSASDIGVGVNLGADVVASNGGITISAEGDVTYSANLNAKKDINISATSINVNGDGSTKGANIIFNSRSDINLGSHSFKADSLLDFSAFGGSILGSSSTLHAYNINLIASQNILLGKMIVQGNIFATAGLDISQHNHISADGNINFESGKNITFSGFDILANSLHVNAEGNITSNKTGFNIAKEMNLNAKGKISLIDSTVLSALIKIKSIELLLQNSSVFSNGDIEMESSKITNDKTSTIIANQNVSLLGDQFLNYGSLKAGENINLLFHYNIYNYAGGKIIADKKIFLSGENFYNYGTLKGGLNVNLNFDKNIYNYAEAEIVAGKDLEINSENGDVWNYAWISGDNLVRIRANNIYNKGTQNGKSQPVIAVSGNTGSIDLMANYIENFWGEIYSNGSITMGGKDGGKANRILNKAGKISAKKDITLNTGVFENIAHSYWKCGNGKPCIYTSYDNSSHEITYQGTQITSGVESWVSSWQNLNDSIISIESILMANGNIVINGDVVNESSKILAGQNLTINGYLNNYAYSQDVTLTSTETYWVYKPENTAGCSQGILTQTGAPADFWTCTRPGQAVDQTYYGAGSVIGAGGNINISSSNKPITNAGISGLSIGNSLVDLNSLTTTGVSMEFGSVTSSLIFVTGSGITNEIIGVGGKPLTFTYLIETNSNFTNYNNFITSTYFLSSLNFDTEKEIILFGDANAERELLTASLTSLNMMEYLNEGAIDALYEDGLDWFLANQEDMNLTPGLALTEAQIASLTTDIILPVFQIIDGVEVLVPQVYLSPATIASMNSANQNQIIAGGDITLSAGSGNISNGGNISSGASITAQTTGDFANIGGSITTGANLNITAENIIFDAEKHETVNGTVLGVGSSITTGGDLTVNANNDFIALGLNADIGGMALIESSGNITIGAAQVTNQTEGATIINGTASNINVNGSLELLAGGDVTITHGVNSLETEFYGYSNVLQTGISSNNLFIASGGDLNITGSNLNAGTGLFSAQAEGSVNIANAYNTSYNTQFENYDSSSSYGYSSHSGGLFSSSSNSFNSSTASNTHISILTENANVVSSNITGNGITIVSGSNFNMIGSNLDSGSSSTSITSGGNVNIQNAYDTTTTSYEAITATTTTTTETTTEKKPFKKKESSTTNTTTQTTTENWEASSSTVASSNISGNGINISSGGNIDITGSSLNAGSSSIALTAEENVNIQNAYDVTAVSYNNSTNSIAENSSSNSSSILFGIYSDKNTQTNTTSESITSTGQSSTGTVVSSNITGNGITIVSGSNFNMIGSNLDSGSSSTSITSGGNVNIQNAYDTNTFSESNTSSFISTQNSSSNASLNLFVYNNDYKKETENIDINNTSSSINSLTGTVVSSQLSGGSIDIYSGGNMNLTSVNLNSEGSIHLSANENINITSAQNINILETTNFSYSESSNSQSSAESHNAGISATIAGVSLGVSYGQLNEKENYNSSINQNIANDFSLTTNTVSSNINAANVNIQTGGDLNLISTNVSGENISLGGNNVTVGALQDISINTSSTSDFTTEATYASTNNEYNGSISIGFSPAPGANISVKDEIKYQNLSSNYTSSLTLQETQTSSINTTISGSSISGGNVNINSTGNTNIISSSISGSESTQINAGGNVNIIALQEINITNSTSSFIKEDIQNSGSFSGFSNSLSGSASIGFDVGKETIISGAGNVGKYEVGSGASTSVNVGIGINYGYENGNKEQSTNFLGITESLLTASTNTIGSSISGGDVSVNSGGNVTIISSTIEAENANINAAGSVTLGALSDVNISIATIENFTNNNHSSLTVDQSGVEASLNIGASINVKPIKGEGSLNQFTGNPQGSLSENGNASVNQNMGLGVGVSVGASSINETLTSSISSIYTSEIQTNLQTSAVSSNISASNISINTGGDLNLISSNINASNEISGNIGGDLNQISLQNINYTNIHNFTNTDSFFETSNTQTDIYSFGANLNYNTSIGISGNANVTGKWENTKDDKDKNQNISFGHLGAAVNTSAGASYGGGGKTEITNTTTNTHQNVHNNTSSGIVENTSLAIQTTNVESSMNGASVNLNVENNINVISKPEINISTELTNSNYSSNSNFLNTYTSSNITSTTSSFEINPSTNINVSVKPLAQITLLGSNPIFGNKPHTINIKPSIPIYKYKSE